VVLASPPSVVPHHGPTLILFVMPVPGAPGEARRRPPVAARPSPRPKGTGVKPGRKATGKDTRTPQQVIAAKLIALGYQPPGRLAHFAWIKGAPVTLTGWYGVIEAITPDPAGGGSLVRVWINPRIETAPARGMAYTTDHYFEVYRYAGGQVTLVGEVDPGPAHRGVLIRY
jgi:hypothetical protein